MVVKLCAALGALVTPFDASIANARQKNVALIARLLAGVKPVSFTPSTLVPVATIVVKALVVAISKRYVIAPAGPCLTAFLTRSTGRGGVCAPVNGPIGTGACTMTSGPIVNRRAALNGPTVPPPSARACQK